MKKLTDSLSWGVFSALLWPFWGLFVVIYFKRTVSVACLRWTYTFTSDLGGMK